MELNNEGFVIKSSSGVEAFSYRSALSGVHLGKGALTTPVKNTSGLYYRLAVGERLTPEQRADIEQRATAWYAARQPAPKAPSRRVAVSEDSKEKED